MAERSAPRRLHWPAILLTVIAVYGILQFLLVPGNRPIGFPVQHDDYNNLAHTTIQLHRLNIRPVSTLVLMWASCAGVTAYYLVLHVLLVGYVCLALVAVLELAGERATPVVGLVGSVIAIFSFELLNDYYEYTGLITNLVSASLGAVAVILLSRGFRSGRRALFAAGGAIALASLLAKEDFLPAILLVPLAAALGLEGRAARRHGALAFAILAPAFATWMAVSKLVVRSPFIQAAIDTYRPDFTPASLVATTWRYLTMTRLTTALAIAGLVSLALAGALRDRERLARLVLLQFFTLALVAPYAALPRHMAGYYCLNWVPFQAGVLLVFVPARVASRVANGARWVILLLCIGFAAFTHPQRRAAIARYLELARQNEAIVRTVVANGTALSRYAEVGVTGVPDANPWFATDASFLANRYGIRNRWVVFVPGDSRYLELIRILLSGTRTGRVETAPLEDLARRSALPTLALRPDGGGTLLAPDQGLRSTAAPAEGAIAASPDPIPVCDGTGLGMTRLRWSAPTSGPLQVRVNSASGPLFAETAGAGSQETGKWVSDGTVFVLLEHRVDADQVLATIRVRVSPDGCR